MISSLSCTELDFQFLTPFEQSFLLTIECDIIVLLRFLLFSVILLHAQLSEEYPLSFSLTSQEI